MTNFENFFEIQITLKALKLKFTYRYLIICLIVSSILMSCNPTRKLKDGEYLLNKNIVIDKNTKIDKHDIESYIKQKPNRKILVLFRFHLWLHNLVHEDRLKRKRIYQNKKNELKNKSRIANGKEIKIYNRQLLGEWLLDIGEMPVIYDSLVAKKSSTQIKLLLNNKGYFISSVSDSVHLSKRKTATVYYKIKASKPYLINQIEYKIPDNLLGYFVFGDTAKSLIIRGDNYDEDVLQKERERITRELNNNGYYLFSKDYIHYEIDTTIGNRKVNVTLNIKNFASKSIESADSIVETHHQRFYINNIYIQPDFISKIMNSEKMDTIKINDYTIIHNQKLGYKTKILLDAIFIRKGELYQLSNIEDTYLRLSELKTFKSINIFFTPNRSGYLDCNIQLSPILKQSLTVETEGTNTSGNLGIGGSVVYQNRNLFKGSEIFELRLKGSVEAQKTIYNSTDVNPVKQFNTVEFGPELNIYTPRFLIPFNVSTSKISNPKTIFTSSVIYQRRQDYTRYISNLSFGYTWKETAKIRHTINPLIISFVKVSLRPDFYSKLIENEHNLYILNSFSNHLSTSTRYTYNYNEQDIKKTGNFSFFKLNAESSGNILRGIYNTVNTILPNTFTKDQLGRYKIIDIVYSQYIRIDVDYRYYFTVNDINKLAFRLAAGIGKPFVNFQSLPFERSFYSGGSNGIRAWQSRSLGPGSYSNEGPYIFDQFGDGQLEGNFEYRFKLIKFLNGAFFVDAGNTWLRQPDINRPGGDFQYNRFYKEIAVGSGLGLRADFDFFIIRFDIGIKLRDPQFQENKRWTIQHILDNNWKNDFYMSHSGHKYNFFTFNIGIGYPF